MIFSDLFSALSFILDAFKGAIRIKGKIPKLIINDISIIADNSFNPESMFIDCFISNNTTERISVGSFHLIQPNGKGYRCVTDDLGAIGGRYLANILPMPIDPSTMLRVIIEFNYTPKLSAWINRIKKKNGGIAYLRAHTNRGDLGTFFHASINENMEDWYSGRSIAMKRSEQSLEGAVK